MRQCVVWSLFADSNQTASLRNVTYKGETFQITNHFFPFKHSVVPVCKISDSDITRSLKADTDDRFVAQWITAQKLDAASQELRSITGLELTKGIGTRAGGKSSDVLSRSGWKPNGLSDRIAPSASAEGASTTTRLGIVSSVQNSIASFSFPHCEQRERTTSGSSV